MRKTVTVPYASDLEREALYARNKAAVDARGRLEEGLLQVARRVPVGVPEGVSPLLQIGGDGVVVTWDEPETAPAEPPPAAAAANSE